jgi:hypothetical protein
LTNPRRLVSSMLHISFSIFAFPYSGVVTLLLAHKEFSACFAN